MPSPLPLLTLQSAPETTAPAERATEPGVLELLGDPSAWVQRALDVAPAVARAALVLLLFWGLFRVARPALRKVLGRAQLDESLIALLVDSLLKWSLLLVGLVMAIGQLGFDVTAAIAGLGVAGLAVGLAAQDAIANGIGGITIFLDKPFKVGDWITTGEVTGTVAEIRLRTTRIRTVQNTYLVVPNKHIVDSTIVNRTMYGEVRVDIPVGVAYREDVRAARRVLLAALEGQELILPGRSEVVLESLGDSSVNLSLRVWVDEPSKEPRAHVACLEAGKLALDAAGIQIPYPHLQLFLERLEEPAVEGLRRALTRTA